MEEELDTLEQMGAYREVNRESWMHVLGSTWAFKCKRFPDGRQRKLKSRFCVRGDQQQEGIDFFDTFAPVVQWCTIRLLLILSILLQLETVQVDYTAAFLHAFVQEDVYVELPRGFRKKGKYINFSEVYMD